MGKKRTVLVGQSGGPTAAINASLAGVIACAREAGAHTLGMRYGIEGLLEDRTVDLDAAAPDAKALELLALTPASYLGSCRCKLPDYQEDEAPYQKLFALFDELSVDAVLYIGGNDSMDTISKLSAYGAEKESPIRFVGVPKTIDNDLMATDHTPGYGSAAKFIATAVGEIARDASVYDLKSVEVIEIMGRNAGWLAAAAALASSPELPCPDLVLLPEVPQTEERIVERVASLLEHKNTVVIAASEGVRDASGKLLCEAGGAKAAKDAFGHEVALSGTCRYLAGVLKRELHVKTRGTELSTLQRAATHCASATDLAEAKSLGAAAVRAAFAGSTGIMCTIERVSSLPYQTKIGTVAIADVANEERTVPASMIAADGMHVTDAYLRYARPLIAGEPHPLYVDGMPLRLPALDAASC